MLTKYAIHTAPVPHRFEPLTRSGIIAWEEGCLKCPVCVKKQCVYGVYDNRGLNPRQMMDTIDNRCMNCLRCVQGCPKELIHKSINPEYKGMGDAYWTPDIIASLWFQAETGKIPVSGAGYPGPFSGPGFDAMWTGLDDRRPGLGARRPGAGAGRPELSARRPGLGARRPGARCQAAGGWCRTARA